MSKFQIEEQQLRDILEILAELPYKDVHIPMLILEQLPRIPEPEGSTNELIEG